MIGLEYGRPRGSFQKAANDYDARQHVTRELFDATIAHFEPELSIPILSILNLAGPWICYHSRWRQTLHIYKPKRHVTSSTHPRLKSTKKVAFRNTEPAGTIWDQTSYQTPQPGIFLSSGGGLYELLTTSGIVVGDNMVIDTLPCPVMVSHWASNQFITQMQMAHYLAEFMTAIEKAISRY